MKNPNEEFFLSIFISRISLQDGTEMTSENTSSRDQVYQPPKIAAVPYTDDPAAIREEKRRERVSVITSHQDYQI